MGWRKLTQKSIADGGYTEVGVYSGERFVAPLKFDAHLSCSVKHQFIQIFLVHKGAKIDKYFMLRTEFVNFNLSLDIGCFGGFC
jgi:hypothetical protein